jgi:hypothetical protein
MQILWLPTQADGARHPAPRRLLHSGRHSRSRVAGVLGLVLAVAATFPDTAAGQDPLAPTNLQATLSGTVLTLTWVAPIAPPAGYRIEAGTAPGLSDIATANVAATPTSITAPVPNGTYFIRVRAVHAGIPSAPSNEVTVVVGCTSAPPAPAGFGVTQGPGGNPVQFSWQAPAVAVDSYQLEAGTGPGLANLATASLPGGFTSFGVTAPPGTYFVRLRARNACGLSGPSQEVVVVVGTACVSPSAPVLTATAIGSMVTLSWTAPATGTGPFSYTLAAGTSPGASNLATAAMGTLTSIQAPVPSGTYYVRVTATNACGATTSNEVVVVVGGSGGTPNLTFTVTPNPVPFTGVFPGCAGIPTAQKTWVYSLTIANQGSGPFTISSFTGRFSSPILPNPVDVPYTANDFALAFGASSIAAGGSVQGPLCVAGHHDDATLVWTFRDVTGATFTAPAILFLRSPI